MVAKRSRKKVRVRRITVDERLANDLIRLTICPLAEGVEEFLDRQSDWGREREVWARPKTYARTLGVPSAEAPPWETLEEGQVFLSGEFEIVEPESVGDRTPQKYFRVSPGRKNFLRIDDMKEFKEGVKQIYSDVLRGR